MTLYESYNFIERDCGRDVPEGCQSGEAFDNWFGWAVSQANHMPTVAHMLNERELRHLRNQVEVSLSVNGHALQCQDTVDKPSGTGFLFRGVLAENAIEDVKHDLYRVGYDALIEVRGGATAVVVRK